MKKRIFIGVILFVMFFANAHTDKCTFGDCENAYGTYV